ncbi:ATP-dependent DNA helicase RecQ [Muribaculaceae bacterium]|uniref:RecQ family ATP-dependent DNA helicase n=1 Tax=Sangeribacter muris TaxID=2880703 RepID=UPI000FFF4AB6|nr:ATP-dependent DNA helicase RecQ [Sangeribacter muris]MBJ2193326.1 RecQ family ATP-dependent DNA helicase [Muribaculaceae bacterium]RXE69082.1 RecQ family ATP-dependent DNA helicase [Muribaculaceae bacterium Isolate-001 (NCI)]GFI58675.1 ATP-dependent DNA helicase RecQ [Muribaculaceae bacterium]
MDSTVIRNILKKHWGYESFRPLQEDIIMSVLSGRDTLGLMPTGGGKSITFQVPAMALPGLTVVVTPLISLMKDQVDNLRRRRVKAVYLHSGMTVRESKIAREKLINGGAKLLYVSPERLRNQRFIQELRMTEVSLIVVDEAHCISQWGYDFRPSYLNIRSLRKIFPKVNVLALTATATPHVESDILRQLEMKDAALFRMSFSRSNLNYIVRNTETKIYEIFHILSRTEGSAIVYVRSRKRTREIAEYLSSAGISSTYYHAGLDISLKEERQNEWQRSGVRVMVATNAFGMGIDKPDVRVVIHFDMPPSLEEYYQEAGRAGRDGKKSYVVLLTSRADSGLLRRRVTETFPPREEIKLLYERVCNYLHVSMDEGYEKLAEFDVERFCEVFSYQRRRCLACLHLLGQAGYLEYLEETEHRSRVMMTCTREELYHVDRLSADADLVLTRILRLYSGLFAEYVYIDERVISRESGIDERRVYESLLELGRRKVLSYVPRSRSPYIYFPTAREDKRYVMIGKDIYEDRKKVISERTEAMIDYGFGKGKCREKILLEYFGEQDGKDCGRCDICRGRNQRSGEKEENRLARIVEYIRSRPGGADIRIMERDLRIVPSQLSEYLSYLCGEGFVILEDGLYRYRR